MRAKYCSGCDIRRNEPLKVGCVYRQHCLRSCSLSPAACQHPFTHCWCLTVADTLGARQDGWATHTPAWCTLLLGQLGDNQRDRDWKIGWERKEEESRAEIISTVFLAHLWIYLAWHPHQLTSNLHLEKSCRGLKCSVFLAYCDEDNWCPLNIPV